MLPHTGQGAGTGIGDAAIVIALHLEHFQVRLVSRSLAVMMRWGLPRCLMTLFLSTP
jgi:2-polyprenyl-6-methoxyphenol hydroxylase-like FAD-dependent oxidoreductase